MSSRTASMAEVGGKEWGRATIMLLLMCDSSAIPLTRPLQY